MGQAESLRPRSFFEIDCRYGHDDGEVAGTGKRTSIFRMEAAYDRIWGRKEGMKYASLPLQELRFYIQAGGRARKLSGLREAGSAAGSERRSRRI